MKAVFSIFAVIFMQLSVATLADTKPYIWNNGTKTDLDKIADAKTLLSAEKYETYRALLKEKDCDSAAIVLNKAFIEKYPEMSFAQEAESYTYLEWKRLFSDAKYLELSFCFDVNEFEALEEKRKSSKALIGKFYAWEPPITYNKDWEARDWSIRHIISLADDGHLPALVYVGQMARQGDIFDKSKEIEFFIFARRAQ